MDKKRVINRVVYIKALLSKAKNDSTKPDPYASFSLLSFHDVVEMVFILLCEKYHIQSTSLKFQQYIQKIDEAIEKNNDKPLINKSFLGKVNEIRNALKHQGVLVAPKEVQEASVAVESFTITTIKDHFDLDFENLSLLELISNKKISKYLNFADENWKNSKPDKAMEFIAVAFEYVLSDYSNTKTEHYQSPFYVGRDMTFLSSFHMGMDRLDSKLSDFIDRTKESLEAMQKIVRILAYGIDYKQYILFSHLTPHIDFTMGKNEDGDRTYYASTKTSKVVRSEYDFCFNFVVELALHLQEMDYEIKAEHQRIND